MAETNLNIQTMGQPGARSENLSVQAQEFYDKHIIANAKPNLVHGQFGQKSPIPKRNGDTVRYRHCSPLPIPTEPLTEGVTPKGNHLQWGEKRTSVKQFGDYIGISDIVDMTAIDDQLVWAGKQLGQQAGIALDTYIRDIINAGKNVQYANNKAARAALGATDYLTVQEIKKAVRTLKRNGAQPINGHYVGIIHPDSTYDLMNDPKWLDPKTYVDTKDIYKGEIGSLYGVRFVETAQAKVFYGGEIITGVESLQISKIDGSDIYVHETLTAAQATALANKKINANGFIYTVTSAAAGESGKAKLTLSASPASSISVDMTIYNGIGAAAGKPVYSTLILGADAYGIVDIETGGLKNIIKQLGSAGTGDPLDQRATSGWKAMQGSIILTEEFMVRIETVSSFGA